MFTYTVALKGVAAACARATWRFLGRLSAWRRTPSVWALINVANGILKFILRHLIWFHWFSWCPWSHRSSWNVWTPNLWQPTKSTDSTSLPEAYPLICRMTSPVFPALSIFGIICQTGFISMLASWHAWRPGPLILKSIIGMTIQRLMACSVRDFPAAYNIVAYLFVLFICWNHNFWIHQCILSWFHFAS